MSIADYHTPMCYTQLLTPTLALLPTLTSLETIESYGQVVALDGIRPLKSNRLRERSKNDRPLAEPKSIVYNDYIQFGQQPKSARSQ